ncbi:Gfo/Idh/MocA family oxidoreductase [Candidatus Parcubacteria bacterium]|nr:Gfo/Idh/MocA family oxidoreductase [Candidatus Parcubacteria bacterium]
MKIYAIIPARGGSKGVPGKNVKLLNGKPLIAWTIEAARNVPAISKVIVNTDDTEIAEVSAKHGAEVFMRPKELAEDLTLDLPVFEHHLKYLKDNNDLPDMVVDLRATAPLRHHNRIKEGIDLLLKLGKKGADSVRAVSKAAKHPYKMWKLENNFITPYLSEEITGLKEPYNAPRQIFPKVYQNNGSMNAFWPEIVLEKKSMTGDKIAGYTMEDWDMIKVKIIGAGSIGNHLAQASRRNGWDVTIVDMDPKALERMKTDIYPTRYGAWDPEIKLFEPKDAPKEGFDVIFIGTPPHIRMPIATELVKEKPKVLQLEKPLCGPGLEGYKEFMAEYKKAGNVIGIMGYDHAVSKSIDFVASLLEKKIIGDVETVDVEFREHWGGIFKAHPWLSGPKDSYLGFRSKGGGASGEHSHALHLWQYLSRLSGLGTWKEMSTIMEIHKDGGVDYDSIAAFTFITDKGKVGRVVQDVVTSPTRKWARIQGKDGYIEWFCNGHEKGDLVRYMGADKKVEEKIFEKKRPDDFYAEVLHIQDILDGKVKESPVSLESGIRVMEVLNTALVNGGQTIVPIREI